MYVFATQTDRSRGQKTVKNFYNGKKAFKKYVNRIYQCEWILITRHNLITQNMKKTFCLVILKQGNIKKKKGNFQAH